ncbi:hypothetical protein Z043_112142 [Scleropages formosus]|uniref:TRAF-interacting protein with FHA domain-containing protein A n=1 Tax=Scleropages formosus TaxID=113540 RepID=A0A0P7U4S2_SCLFO|nr:hypothetical protein Z043_112142 [Scleropages formosus]
MDVSQTANTEELRTCLHIRLFNPQQVVRSLYHCLPLDRRHVHPAEDPLRFGRDAQACTFALADPRVSRKQLSLQAFRTSRSSELLFVVQNLSRTGRLSVNGAELLYLERAELPDKALLRFGQYELVIWQQPGDAGDSFEVEFEVARGSPCQEMGQGVPCRTPVMDSGLLVSQCPVSIDHSQGPLEMDERISLP